MATGGHRIFYRCRRGTSEWLLLWGTVLEIKLTYDTAKDKYYLDIHSGKQTDTVTFYGEYALEEYLRANFDFDTEKINKLYTDMRQIKYI